MNGEMKRKAWRRLHMEQPYSMTQDRVSGGLAHLYAGLKHYENAGYEALGGQIAHLARRAKLARRLIERRVIVTRDEATQYIMEGIDAPILDD